MKYLAVHINTEEPIIRRGCQELFDAFVAGISYSGTETASKMAHESIDEAAKWLISEGCDEDDVEEAVVLARLSPQTVGLTIDAPTYYGNELPYERDFGDPSIPVTCVEEAGLRVVLGRPDCYDPDVLPQFIFERQRGRWVVFVDLDHFRASECCASIPDSGEATFDVSKRFLVL